MPITLITILILAQAPAATQPPPPAPPINVTAKKAKKKKEDCKFIQLTGSRMRQRVCRDEFGDFGYGPGVSEAGPNAGMVHATPGPAKGGLGGVPQ